MAELILEKILVAIDFSEESNVAMEQAVIAAKLGDAELILLWVSPAPTVGEIYGSTGTAEVNRLYADARSAGVVKLRILEDRVKNAGVRVISRIEPGYPDEVIVQVAEETGAALIFMGTRGYSGLKRLLLGSVAEKVVRTSTTNVVVARDKARPLERILVATDFSPASERALQMALALAAAGAEIDVLHAWQYPPGTHGIKTPEPTSGPLVELHDEIVHRVDTLGAALVKRYSSGSRKLRFVREFGAAREALHHKLESGSYDLVAMGTHGYRGFQRFLLGSVAEATVRYAPCSVLIAHPHHGQE